MLRCAGDIALGHLTHASKLGTPGFGSSTSGFRAICRTNMQLECWEMPVCPLPWPHRTGDEGAQERDGQAWKEAKGTARYSKADTHGCLLRAFYCVPEVLLLCKDEVDRRTKDISERHAEELAALKLAKAEQDRDSDDGDAGGGDATSKDDSGCEQVVDVASLMAGASLYGSAEPNDRVRANSSTVLYGTFQSVGCSEHFLDPL